MKTFFQNPKSLLIAALVFVTSRAAVAFANPTGLTVSSGSASAQQVGSQLNVSVSQLAVLNWQSFNIQNGETTSFLQPSANSVVFNVIGGANPSQIFGNLKANGTVILANANGFYFGPDSMVKVGGSFIATTAPLPPDFGFGAGWQFTGMPPLASIVNYGQIEVGNGKSLYLIAEKIENHGSLNAPGGDIELAAGSEVLVSQSADGRSLSASVKLPSGSVDNFGRITADAGTIALQAKVVNQDGIIQADSIAEKNGVIELVASDSLNLGADSKISARGDDSPGGSAGGNVTIKSENNFSDVAGSSIVTTGGANGGNGGDVEVSAPNINSLESAMDATARTGYWGGTFLLDPANIVLGTTGNGVVPANGTVPYTGAGTLNLNVNTAFANKNFSSIKLQATQNITLAANTTWNLSGSTGVDAGLLTLQAGGDIIFNTGAKITDANNWGVKLDAGYDFANSVFKSTGNIYLNGGAGKNLNGSISLAGGDINLTAGNSVLVGTGFIRTTAGGNTGGNISVLALGGDISVGTGVSGTLNSGYDFSTDNALFPNGYRVTDNLGGISTKAGGSVMLIANGSINPSASATTFAISGAFGSAPGDVTLVAGTLVQGNFNIANGTGRIFSGVQLNGSQPQITGAGADVGSTTLPLTLALISGSWNIWAANNVYINEVLNPNGTFNANAVSVEAANYSDNTDGTGVPTRTKFLNNYAADAAVNIWAGNSIDLVGANLRRPNGYPGTVTAPIYAPQLSLNAGAGGIVIERSIILAPSKQGSLNITTRDGGNLTGGPLLNDLIGIIMSDSGVPKIETYEQGHALTPLHLNDANPVKLDIDGNIESFALTVPTFAEINVAGDTYNFGFLGRNLSASQTTLINVTGDINYRGNLTSEILSVVDGQNNPDPITQKLFDAVISGDPTLEGKLFFAAATGKLTYIGVLSDATFLLNPVDADGKAVAFDAFQLAAWQTAINNLSTESQTASLGDHGLAISGPGTFKLKAHAIDLGISGGISVLAPDAALEAISPYGALLDVATLGNLSMTATKIANESFHGGIKVNVGGALDIGGQFTTFGDDTSPKGIITTSGGNISITAAGNVNVNGSRIAAFNGGNVDVTSLNGDVNAGLGGAGYVSFQALEIDPLTGKLTGIPAKIPFSGIVATTVFGSHAALGDITISSPNGSINANRGGVLQIAFNDADTKDNFVDVTAGKDINATGSGIIGSNIRLKADGDINGAIIGSESINIQSEHNVDVTAVSGGSVDIGAAGSVSGTIVGGGEVSVSGDSIDAAVMGGSVATSGDTSGASLGLPTSNVTKENNETADNANTATGKSDSGDEEDPLKKKKGIALAQKVSRVTVLLPAKN